MKFKLLLKTADGLVLYVFSLVRLRLTFMLTLIGQPQRIGKHFTVIGCSRTDFLASLREFPSGKETFNLLPLHLRLIKERANMKRSFVLVKRI